MRGLSAIISRFVRFFARGPEPSFAVDVSAWGSAFAALDDRARFLPLRAALALSGLSDRPCVLVEMAEPVLAVSAPAGGAVPESEPVPKASPDAMSMSKAVQVLLGSGTCFASPPEPEPEPVLGPVLGPVLRPVFGPVLGTVLAGLGLSP